jgi:hypothetical protein
MDHSSCLKCKKDILLIEETDIFFCQDCRLFWFHSELVRFKTYEDYLKTPPKGIVFKYE